MEFETAYTNFFKELGESKCMVLSTSVRNVVSSRTMSVIILRKQFYFQTDKTFRKYREIQENNNVSLCIDNIQVQGQCQEIGNPCENEEFSEAYKKYFPSAYKKYTFLNNERLFVVKPTFIEKWNYLNNIPHIETFDILQKEYHFRAYMGV